MGKRARLRRKAAARMAAGAPAPGAAPTGPPPSAPRDAPDALDVEKAVSNAAHACYVGDDLVSDAVRTLLVQHWAADPHRVPAAVGSALEGAVRRAWASGWQPADVHRLLTRRGGGRHARLGLDAIAAQARSYRDSPGADGRWLGQLDDLGAAVWWPPDTAHLVAWARREGVSRWAALGCALEVLGTLWHLPVLPKLGPPPDQWPATPTRIGTGRPGTSSGVEAKLLDRVRGLLAKAESTEFTAEAEAYTAKAQQMMSRHAIDHAMLAPEETGEPEGRRLGVEDPYARAKAMLVQQVAEATRCRTVWYSDLGFVTVLGFAADLDAVELLYTSLLVQATTALLAAGAGDRRGRSAAFRRSFLTSFALRIGERLRRTEAATVAEATAAHGSALLPVLAARSRAVDDALDRLFPDLHRRRVTISDEAGWVAGRVAADLASLARGAAVDQARSA